MFGRQHTNLRISVTDRCNIRCFYCMPAENVPFMERKELLTYEEIGRFVRIIDPLGVEKIRLTGGEPLVRRDLDRLVARIVRVPGIRDVGTDNERPPPRGAGRRAVLREDCGGSNVSLDALDPVKFREVTRRDGYEQVLAGLEAAERAGFREIKINAVSIRGMTDDEIVPFGHFARRTGHEVRFIEYMPLDAESAWEREKVLFASEIVERLSRELMPPRPAPACGPARPGDRVRL